MRLLPRFTHRLFFCRPPLRKSDMPCAFPNASATTGFPERASHGSRESNMPPRYLMHRQPLPAQVIYRRSPECAVRRCDEEANAPIAPVPTLVRARSPVPSTPFSPRRICAYVQTTARRGIPANGRARAEIPFAAAPHGRDITETVTITAKPRQGAFLYYIYAVLCYKVSRFYGILFSLI